MIESKVSVIMPAFNAELYIEEAIRSVIAQTFQNWELIIINDGSTDTTLAIADKYVLKDDRIKLINQENKKLGAARNAGIINSNGDWIAFLDADDLWVPLKLEKQLQISQAYPQAGVIFSDGYIFSKYINEKTSYGTVSGFFEANAMYKLEYKANYIPVLSVLVKKKHLDEIGLQDENPNIYGCEDWDYWLRLAIDGVSFFGMRDNLFYYRKHLTNMSNDNDLMTLSKATTFIKNFRRELLSSIEIEKINSFINITVCNFLRIGKTKEALFLNGEMDHAFETNSRKISTSLIRIFKSRSYLMVRAVYKINSVLNLMKAT